jgi:phytoene dehydrogenase-like protein
VAPLELSRREWLLALAGVGASSCLRRATPELTHITGGIVGASHQRGHLLRDGFHPQPKRRETTAVAILGGGIAGLSAAWALERAGLRDFLVLELEDVAGGTARSGANPVSAYPWGAHYVPVPDPGHRALVALLEDVGAVTGKDAAGRPVYAESVLCRDPEERVFYRGEWYEGLYPRVGASASDRAQLAAFEGEMGRWAGWHDARGRRGFALPRVLSSDSDEPRALDGMTMDAWMRAKGFDSRHLRWLVEYGCRDDFGATLAQTSAWAGVHYFAARLAGPGAEPAEFLTWPEGNGRLVRELVSRAGPRLRAGALVASVEPGPTGVSIVYFDERSQEAVELRAEHAVCAVPRFLASRLVVPWRERPPAFLGETVYGSWMVANLTLRERPQGRGFPLAWDNVLYDSPALGYVVATHQSHRDYGPTVLTYYLPLLDDDVRAARARLLATPWATWVDAILGDLERAHPGLREIVDNVDVMLWGHAMVRPRPGFMWSEALRASARPLGRLHFAHTDLSGMALFEEAQYWGIHAAEAILRDRTHAFSSWLA